MLLALVVIDVLYVLSALGGLMMGGSFVRALVALVLVAALPTIVALIATRKARAAWQQSAPAIAKKWHGVQIAMVIIALAPLSATVLDG